MKNEVREQIRHLRILSKRLVLTSISGGYLSAFKGHGFEFEQLREYVMGDDVRFLDWNASAKVGSLMFKESVPERDRVVIFAVDCSGSAGYSSHADLKRDVVLRFCSALSFVAGDGGDRVGALLFGGGLLRWFEPQRGEAHLAQITEALCSELQRGGRADFGEAFKFLVSLKRRNAILFLVSDWVVEEDEAFERLLRVVACEYEMVAVRVTDKCEESLPDVGVLQLCDPETGEEILVDTGAPEMRWLRERFAKQRQSLERSGADVLDIRVGGHMARELASFFHKRIGRQV